MQLTKVVENLRRGLRQAFPETPLARRKPPLRHRLCLFLLVFLSASWLAGRLVPADGFRAYDWLHFFQSSNIPVYYPPWTKWVVPALTWPTLIGLTFAGAGVASYERARHGLSLACALLTLPVLWTLFLGQIDGIVLLGVLGLPWLAPLALLKPHISLFAALQGAVTYLQHCSR